MLRNDAYRSIARFFPLLNRILDAVLKQVRLDLISLLKRRHVSRILDLGCGTGELSRLLADNGFAPTGMDLSPSMLAAAAGQATRIPAFLLAMGDGGHLPFKPAFDSVVMRLVFHEMDPVLRRAVWKEASSVLNPGGLILLIDFTHPDKPGIYPAWGRFFIKTIERQMRRIHEPHYANYRELMRQGGTTAWVRTFGGLIVEEHRYAGGNLGLLAVNPFPEKEESL